MGDEQNFSIRPFTDAASDYQALAALYNYAYPEAKRTPTEFKIVDWMRDPNLACKRWVAEKDAAVKGVGGFEHWGDFYHPHKYLLHLVVNSDEQGQGIGGALYDHVVGELSRLRPQTARVGGAGPRAQLSFCRGARFRQRETEMELLAARRAVL